MAPAPHATRQGSTPTPSSWRCWPQPRVAPTPIPTTPASGSTHRCSARPWAAGSSPASPTASRCCGSPHFGKGADLDATARMRVARWGIPAEEVDEFFEFFERRQSILTLNPPDHTRLRGLVARAFTPNTVEALRPHVVALCDGLLDTLADLAERWGQRRRHGRARLPPPCGGDRRAPRRARWRTGPSSRLWSGPPRASSSRCRPSRTCAAPARPGRRWSGTSGISSPSGGDGPTDDLLSELIAVSDGSDRLTQDEVISTAILLFAAGFETTTNLIGNGLWALLGHPEQLTRLRALGGRRRRGATGGGRAVAMGQPGPARRPGGVAADGHRGPGHRGRRAGDDAARSGQPRSTPVPRARDPRPRARRGGADELRERDPLLPGSRTRPPRGAGVLRSAPDAFQAHRARRADGDRHRDSITLRGSPACRWV